MKNRHNIDMFLYMLHYCCADEAKMKEDSEKMFKELQEQFDRDEKKQKSLEFEHNHPELAPLTPKEYGMKLLKRRKH